MIILEDILSQEIIQKLGWTLVHFIWQAAVVALLLAILLRILRKSTANLRYIFACLALALIVLLPVITIQLIPVSVPHMATYIEPAPVPAVLPMEEMPAAETIIVEEPEQLESVAPISADSWKQRAVDTLEPALPYIVSGWLFGVLGLSIWHLGGWTQLQRLKRRMVKQVDSTLLNKLKVLTQRLRVKQTVQLLESALVQIPTVVGWLRPVILLPASALTGLSTEQLEALLAHELAHIRRCDYLLNILQTVVETLGFYHPAVWWVSHKIRVERENCCDDLAVSLSGDRVRYARALTSMEEIRARRNELAVAATGGNLSGRIRRLVGKDSTDSSRTSWIPSVVTILLIAIIVIPTTLALTTGRTDDPSDTNLETILLDGFRENRSKFKCGVLAWTRTTKNDGFTEGPKSETKGSFQLWWDGKKIATKYVDERVFSDSTGRRWRIEAQTGGNAYDGSLLSRKPKFRLYENWFDEVICWTGPLPLDKDIATMKKLRHVSLDWSIIEVEGEKQIKLSINNLKDGASGIRYFDLSKGCNQVRREIYNAQGRLYSQQTRKLQQVNGGGWFPVEVDMKSINREGKVTLHQRFVLDMKRCSFNDRLAIPDGIFEFSTAKEEEQLNKILKQFSDSASVGPPDTSDNNGQLVRESVENFIAAALAGKDEKAATFAYPDTAVAEQIDDMREALQGQQVRIVGICAGDWNASAISSVIQGDHGRIGPLLFHTKKVILDQKVHWLIDDIDLETLDTIEQEIKRFLERNPKAKTVIFKPQRPVINPDNNVGNQTDVQVRDEDYNNSVKESLEKAGARLTFNEQDKIAEIYFGGKATDEGLVFLRGLTDLERLNLETGKITNDELANIAGLDKLRYLSLYETQITDEALVHLRGLTNLQELLLHGNKITDAGLENLKNLTNLHILNIRHTSWVNAQMEISDAGMVHLKGLAKLRTLDLLGTDVTAAGLEHLTALPELETLILSGPKITDEAMETLVKMKSLKRLELRFTNVTDKGIEYLNKMPNLEMLNLASRNITDAGLVHIEALKQLKKLELRGTNFGDSSLEYVAKLPQLERLDLSDDGTLPWQTQNKYTAAGLALLKNIKTLRVLWLYGVRTGDAEIKQLAAIKNLEELTLFRPAVDTNTGDIRDKILEMRRDLRRALPDTRIVVGGFDFFTLPDLDEDQLSAQSEYMKTLASGVTVELIGMCEYPSADKQWWQPDGSLLVNPPYDERDTDILSYRKPDAIPIEFAFRLSGNLGEPAWEARVKGDDQAFVWWTGRRAKDGEFLTDIKSIGMFVKSDQKTLDLRLGFSIAGRPYEWVEFKNISIMPNMSKYTVFNSEKRIFRSFDQGEEQILKRFFNRVDSEIQKLKNNHPYLSDWDKEKTETESISTGKEIIDTRLTYNHATYSGKSPGGRKDWCGQDGCYIKIKIYTGLEGPYMKTRVFPLKGRLSVIATVITGNPENPELEQKINEIIHLAAVSAVQESDLQVEPELAQLRAAFEAQKFAHSRDGFIALVQEIGNKEPESFLIEQLESDNRARRCQAALALEILGDRRGIPAIVRELNDTSYRPTTRIRSFGGQDQKGQIRQDHYYAALLLGISGDKRAVPALIEATRDEEINYQAAISLGQIGDMRAIPALRAMLEKYSNEPFVRLFAGYGLAMLNDEEGLRVVIDTLNNQELHWVDRRHAIRALGELRDKQAVPHLIVALKDDHPNIRVSAARALGAIGDASALLALEQALKDKTETKANTPTTVSKAAAEAIAQIRAEGRKAAVKVEAKSAESGEKLKQLGLVVAMYAEDNDKKLPDTLEVLKPYIANEQDFLWIVNNVEYLGQGKSRQAGKTGSTPIAYDKTLLGKANGTNVVFLDGHVEFLTPQRLTELGISASEILIDTRLLSVSEDFLQSIGLDANSVSSSDAWSEHLVADSAADPNSETYSLILDELHIRFLLKAVQAHQDAKMLISPRVSVIDGKSAKITTHRTIQYISGYSEPNSPSDEPEPKKDKVEIGTRVWLKPELTPDNQNIKLDFKMEIRQLLGYEERKYKGKYPYKIPKVDVVSTKMPCLIPDGKTLLIAGLKIIEQVESWSGAPRLSDLPLIGVVFSRSTKTRDNKMLLILVKPTINPQQKASKILPGQADSEEHIKSLGRLLEKKLNPPAEPK